MSYFSLNHSKFSSSQLGRMGADDATCYRTARPNGYLPLCKSKTWAKVEKNVFSKIADAAFSSAKAMGSHGCQLNTLLVVSQAVPPTLPS